MSVLLLKRNLCWLPCAAMALAFWIAPVWSHAATLDSLFSPGMVLQRDRTITLRGTGEDGEHIIVSLAGKSAKTVTRGGLWSVTLGPFPPGGPHEIRVVGHQEIVVPEVWFGDVWLCSGQSNMARPVAATDTPANTLSTEDFRGIHLLSIPKEESATRRQQMNARWQNTSVASVSRFSATCFFFGNALAKRLKVPIGLIDASMGGSHIGAWIREDSLQAIPDYAAVFSLLKARSDKEISNPGVRRPKLIMPSTLYNGMIAPLGALPIQGILWYQGEAETGRAGSYIRLLQTLAGDWRSLWNASDLPFIYIQLSGFGELRDTVERSNWAQLREEQLRAESLIANSAMVVSIDLGDVSIHPPRKRPLGERAAAAALGLAYGERLDFRGPRLAKASFDKGGSILSFDVFGNCLASGGEELRGFFLAGENGIWHPAKAAIHGNTVTLTNPDVAKPVAARYAWGNRPVGNLFSCTGLPASPFRTDRWPY